MSAVICPTVTPTTPDAHEYRQQIERLEPFASRVQIDIMDGVFTPTSSIGPAQLWWPDAWVVDIHVMYANPRPHLETLLASLPHMIILHAEASGDVKAMLQHIAQLGVKAGVCLLQKTQPGDAKELIEIADHVLLFAGTLGSFGGMADLGVLDKIAGVRAIKNDIEIGWDGGANAENVTQIAAAGVDVINVGSAIQKANNPQKAYAQLQSIVS